MAYTPYLVFHRHPQLDKYCLELKLRHMDIVADIVSSAYTLRLVDVTILSLERAKEIVIEALKEYGEVDLSNVACVAALVAEYDELIKSFKP